MATTTKKTSIHEALVNIQTTLNVPKTHENKFGGYKYRNTSDILDAVKPLAKKEGCDVIINDDLVMVGNRIYIKATVTLTNSEGESISTAAFAREEESKRGMDASQVTGAASSYARKYALNGLFAIDDTADADALNTSKEYTQPQTKPAAQKQQQTPPVQTINTAKADAANVKSRAEFQAWWANYPTLQQNQEFLAIAQQLGKKFPKTK